jgi:hypothetical protein
MASDRQPTSEQSQLPDYRHAKTRKWRVTIAAAGLVLASAFFMPAVPACNSPIVPVEEFKDALTASPVNAEELLVNSCVYVAAYAFGLLMFIAAVARLMRRPRSHRMIAMMIAVATTVCCLVSIIYLWPVIRDGVLGTPPDLGDLLLAILLCIVIPVLALIHLVFSAPLRANAGLCRMFIACVITVVWFGYWLYVCGINGDWGYYGLHLSFGASIVLLVAVVGESRVMTAHTWRRTIWLLLTCRLRARPDWRGRCPACDYLLFGLTEPRCPECGRAFTPAEVGMAASSDGFLTTTAQRHDENPSTPLRVRRPSP